MKRRRSAPRLVRSDLVYWLLWLLVLLPPLVFSPTAADNFRLPKLLLSELLALSCLMALLWRLSSVERVDWRAVLRQPIVLAVLPILLAAGASVLMTEHPLHGRQALISLVIGALFLIGASLGLRRGEATGMLRGLVFMGATLAALAVVQAHVYNPFQYEGAVNRRIGLTSLAGGAFDLAAYLLLPALLVQVLLWRAKKSGERVRWGLMLALMVYVLTLTQTLSVLLAFGIGTSILWFQLVPRRQFFAIVAMFAIGVAGLSLGVTPLRERLVGKGISLAEGNLNALLSGRLDGWRAALWMWRQDPLLGVGHGAYRAEFGQAKLVLSERGTRFERQLQEVYFVHAHNDALEVLAEQGALGMTALVFGLGMLCVQTRRRVADLRRAERHGEAALIWAALGAMAILSATYFPWHLALVAYSWILFLAWIFAPRPAGDHG